MCAELRTYSQPNSTYEITRSTMHYCNYLMSLACRTSSACMESAGLTSAHLSPRPDSVAFDLCGCDTPISQSCCTSHCTASISSMPSGSRPSILAPTTVQSQHASVQAYWTSGTLPFWICTRVRTFPLFYRLIARRFHSTLIAGQFYCLVYHTSAPAAGFGG